MYIIYIKKAILFLISILAFLIVIVIYVIIFVRITNNKIMARDLEEIKIEGISFKKGKDDSTQKKSTSPYTPRKRKGETVSGASKMRAEYKARKRVRR